VDWRYIAKEARDAETGSEEVKTAFSQQILGEAYRIKVQKADIDAMLDKRAGGIAKAVVPSGFELLTLAFDLNGDWAQGTVYAWGPGGMNVPIDRIRIDGSPEDAELWRGIDQAFRQTYRHEDGGVLAIEGRGVDTGWGTVHVYAYCNRHDRVRALDGASGWGLLPLRRGPMQKLKGPDGTIVKCRTWRVGTWDLKRELLNTAIPAAMEGEAASRQPGKPIWPGWLERDYFEELTAEALQEKQDKKTGFLKPEAWVRLRRRNEEMDLWVYNMALARSLGVGIDGAEPDWIELARRRQPGQLGLDDLWSRPTAATPPTPSAPTGSDGWDWRKNRKTENAA
jgi:phage terminase large subunit GpA-like protein